ncbi:MAG: S8 family peptidase, partial [Pseudomonadota bacterium]
ICLLDSGIITNHPLLGPAIGESANFTDTEDAFDTTEHGTAVAGIAVYGDIETCQANNVWQPEIRLLSGKILDQNNEFDPETIENKIIKAVTYFTEEYRCKIFNLSIGNANAPYDHRHIRGIAYVLDDLARQFDILFVVSSGNFTGSDEPPVPEHSWRDEYPDYLLSDQSLIIDPAPALNVITVGSLARHNATSDAQRYPQEINQLCPATHHQPSPFTRHGPSVKGAIKPDLVAVGGNLAVPMRQEGKQYQTVERGLGVLSCRAKFIGSTLLTEISGTSFAAPYISHLAARLLNTYPEASANLLRALLVNHAHMPDEMTQTFPEAIRESYKKDRKISPENSVAGYGLIDESALFRSSENVVVLMAEEGIEDDTHQFFELPLPAEFLRKKRATREINVTLAYCPAVRTTRLEYIATRINFRLVKDRSLDNLQRSFNHETQKETETRNDDRTSNRKISSALRDKGTIQSSTWKMQQLNPDDKWFVVITRQDKAWGKSLSEHIESYALVITVADRENNAAQLYTQISQRIQQQIAARARV